MSGIGSRGVLREYSVIGPFVGLLLGCIYDRVMIAVAPRPHARAHEVR